jgi:predicted Zn finger-like uncharacterized protein
MKIVCDSCGAKYSIADEKVAGKIFKIRCKKCSSVLEVRGDQTGAHPFDEANSPKDEAGEPGWYIVVDGEQKGPLPPIQLSQLFAKGSVGLDSYVWREGFGDWRVAGEVAELAQLFGGAAVRAKAKGAPRGSEDTSAFGTGGDLFSEGSREPTGEIDTSSNVFAGFDESPTPTDSEGSPLAARAQRDAAGALGGMGFGGGALGTSSPQRMTGQRNENSVLFSLSNLQQLASRGAPAPTGARGSRAPASGASASPQPGGEGSGLIDIRALAKSTTPGTRSAPAQAVDDLLSIGTGLGGATLGAPLLGPVSAESAGDNRWLWIGLAAVAVIAIVGAGVGVGMAIGGSDEDALEIASAGEQPPSQRIVNQVATAAQAPADPPEQAQAAPQPAEAATIEEPAEAEVEPAPAPQLEEPARAARSTSKSERRARSTASTAEPSPAPEPKKPSGNLDALMDEVVGGPSSSKSKSTTTASGSGSSDSSLADAPDRDDVKTALLGVSGAVKACKTDTSGTAAVDVVFSGKTGKATSAKVTSAPFKGTPVGSCIEKAVQRARVPRFKQPSFKVTFPYRL